jgi:hypothetical protein
MIGRIGLSFLALWGFLPIPTQAQQRTTKVDFLSGDQIQTDLDSLRAWILAVHPSPFVHCSQIEFDETWEKSRKTFEGGGTLFSEAQMVARICNTLKDSHTGLSLNSFSMQLGEIYGHVPMEVTTVQNHIMVDYVDATSQCQGAEVVAVNGVSSRSILGSALPLISQEGNAQVARLRMAEKLWNDLAPFVVGVQVGDTAFIELSDGTVEKLPIYSNEEVAQWNEGKGQEESIEWQLPESPSEPAVLIIHDFHPSNASDFKRQLRVAFRSMHRWNAKHGDLNLVLDLRGNSGGHIAVMAELLPYITVESIRIPFGAQIRTSKMAKEQLAFRRHRLGLRGHRYSINLKRMNNALYDEAGDTLLFVPFEVPIKPHRRLVHTGKVALLFDGLSASASVSIASWFIRSGRGATFGEPTMGSISGTFGNPVRYTLPESGLVVNIASARYFTQNPVRWEASPLLPDFPVNLTLSQFQLGLDPAMEAAEDWFRTQH